MLASIFAGNVLRVGKSPVAAVIMSLVTAGTVVGTNFVGRNPNSSFIAETSSYLTPAWAAATNTGGLAKYDTIRLASPFGSGATAKGLRAGTGVVRYLQLDIIANPKAVALDC